MTRSPRLCVFCGARTPRIAEHADKARELGKLMAERGIGLVYGGAHVGVMGTLADAVLAHGGEVIGVIPQALVEKEIAHTGLTELHVVDSMHSRKALMGSLADAFCALPGGFGTMEELFEVITWSYIGLHDKPIVLLNIGGFYGSLFAFLKNAEQAGYVSAKDIARIGSFDAPSALLDFVFPKSRD